MTEVLRLWSVDESGGAEPLSPFRQMTTEWTFEDLLVRNPDMLDSELKLVGRQTPTQTGWLDLLAIDSDGRLVVYELKRGTVTRDAVTQALDYASSLDDMSASHLAKHIAERSGNDGIQQIDDFEQWYADNFGGDELSRLLPPRMVLVGIGVDPVAERMAKFISGGAVDLSVVTFHGFMRGNERLLARQLEVTPGPRDSTHRHRSKSTKEKLQALQEYLAGSEFKSLYDRIHADIRSLLPERGVWEQPGSTGVGFQLPDPDNPKVYKTNFGVQAGYRGSGCSVSILQAAIERAGSAFEQLRDSLQLHDWPHGGHVCYFESEDQWDENKNAVLGFVRSVMQNRSNAGATEN